jgi:hypothetical protein
MCMHVTRTCAGWLQQRSAGSAKNIIHRDSTRLDSTRLDSISSRLANLKAGPDLPSACPSNPSVNVNGGMEASVV